MRLLVVTNYYPPKYFGGYELGCRDVVEGLKRRGHSVAVLTSNYEASAEGCVPGVTRGLHLKRRGSDLLSLCQNVLFFLLTLRRTRPELVYFWNQAGLSFWLAPLARGLGYKCIFFISDASFRSWRVGAFFRRFFAAPDSRKRSSFLLRGLPITRGSHCQFASKFLLQLAQSDSQHETGRVIHWGIDADLFTPPKSDRRPFIPMRILFVGQIIPEKGVDTLVDAVAHLLDKDPVSVRLTLVGGSSKPDYLKHVRQTLSAKRLDEFVHLAGKMDRFDLVEIYREHDVLVLPSVWEEPFAITPLEAMACGLAVVATTTGGSAEIFRDGDNSLTFPAGDVDACATAIARLRTEPGLYERLRRQGMSDVAENFTFEKMIEQIEEDLLSVVHA